MSTSRVIDVSGFSIHGMGTSAPLYWGIWGLILIEAMVFGTLLSSYFYLRLVAPAWPPAGTGRPELLLPTVNTVVLLASSYFVYKADTGIKRGDTRWLKLGLGVGIALALIFLAIKYIEYNGLEYRWNSHAYGSIVWATTGFHTAHVLALVLKTMAVLYFALRGYFNSERNLGVQVNGLYWNFVVAVWIPIYAVLYLSPYVGL